MYERYTMKKLIGRFNLDLSSEENNKELSRSLHNLVTILFAVVFALGLQKFTLVPTPTVDQYLFLILVFIVILQSWWGYHLGTIEGPNERNKLCYFIDVLLLVLYWFLIEYFKNINVLFLCFSVMFLLYTLWELIRFLSPYTEQRYGKAIKEALIINSIYFVLFSFMTLTYIYNWFNSYRPTSLILVIILFGLFIYYRVRISKAYAHKKNKNLGSIMNIKLLINEAKEASNYSYCKLSNFRVGAAIESNNGNIYKGNNIEFYNYSNTIHAEESAIANLFSNGENKLKAIAIYTPGTKLYFPCGKCLQSLFELGGNELVVIACNDRTSEQMKMVDLLPYGFTLEK